MRATSALLSVLGAVDEFGRTILRQRFGAPAGPIETFIEVPLKMADGKVVRPDGLIRVRRGRRTWVALIEVKTARVNWIARRSKRTSTRLATTNSMRS